MHRVLVGGHYDTRATVYDGETALDCYDYNWGPGWCALPRAGAFTLRLDNSSFDPDQASVTVTPLVSNAGCLPTTGTSWNQEPLKGSLVSRVGLICQPFEAKPGERVTLDFQMVVYGDERGWITDATGGPICPVPADGDGCVLPGSGPYRVIGEGSYASEGFPAEYRLKIRRLSDPEGCASVAPNAYGSAPTVVTPATGCKTFTVPTTGSYDVYGVAQPEGQRSRLKVYDQKGEIRCQTWDGICALTSGVTYTVTTDDATLILARAATAGCVQTALGAVEGSFAVPGEIDCLTLPLAENAHLALLTPTRGTAPRPDVLVWNAQGGYVCGDDKLTAGTCVLTGPAPYHVIVSTDDTQPSTGTYRMMLYRTDVANTCPVFPAGDFSATGATVRLTTGGGVFSHCLTIPADAHTANENVQIRPETGAAPAQYSLLDATGKQICQGWSNYGSFTTCALTPGLAHTVLFVGDDAPSAYVLARRDVTTTAKGCAPTPATAVGGPSASGVMGAPGVLVCRQVTTGATGDVLHLDVRDPLGTANILAYDKDGNGVPTCGYRNRSCVVSGSATYQVVLTVPASLKAADAYHFDALRIGTPTGPAPECTKVPALPYGYGPVKGRLDEQHTAVCLALPTAAGDRFKVTTVDTEGRTDTAVPRLYDAKGSDPCYRTSEGYDCGIPGTSGPSPTTFVLGLPEKASLTDFSSRLDCAATPCGTEEVSVGTVSPTTARGGQVVTLAVTGTALGMKDYVRLTNGSKTLTATTVSVSPDARTLTASLDLRTVGESTWNISVITGWEYQRGIFTVTKPAAAGLGTFRPMSPTRLMNTIAGVGVPQGKVGAGKTVTLQVAGKAGIPATGVTAVVMNVTAVAPTAAGYVSVFPAGTARPATSNLNFTAGKTIPNLVVVPLSADGKVSFYNHSGSVDLLADVSGYYVTDGSGATYKPLGPVRMMNTMAGVGVPKARVAGGKTVTLQVTGKSGIPASGVTAVVMNVTAVAPTAAGYVSVFPAGTARPSTSNLNFTAGQTIPNLVVVPLSADGKVTFYNHSGSVDLLADVAGYFTTDGLGSAFNPIAPTRVMDATAGAGGTVTLQVAGKAGIPATGVTAVVMNVTAVAPTATGYVSVFPDGTPRPATSNLNFTAGTTIPNLVVVPVVNGKVSFYNHSGSTRLLADVAGYYVS
ncbi:hypothetical protein [Streptomyces sp. NPDC003943]